MDSKNDSYRIGHRARLKQKFRQGKMVDYELLELLLAYAIPRCDIKPYARRLMERYGNIYKVITAQYDSLVQNPGIKGNSAILFNLVHEIMKTAGRKYLEETPIFHDYQKMLDYCKISMTGKTVEEFHVLYLDMDSKLIIDDLHTIGTIDLAAIYPREVLKRALELNARSVVLMHNHPASPTSFSTEDINITQNIKVLLGAVGIEMFDHLLLSSNGIVHSARNMFLIK